jgi:protein involved in polysaccharide export with SLBB domain
MTISDLLRAGGGLDQSAYSGAAELIRYEVVGGEKRQTELIDLELERVLAGDPAADVALRPFDFLVVKEMPLWREQESIEVLGEVRFPGKYPIKRGETLKSIIERAGGLTDLAFAEGSVFTRKDLKEREQRQLKVLADRLQGELATLSLQLAQSGEAGNTGQAIAAGQGLLADLKATEAVGRLVIDLRGVINAPAGSPNDVVVKDGDKLLIPRQTQEVTVIGEVQSATSHLFDPAISRDEYIAMSGGTTPRADKKRIYVVRASGSVSAGNGSSWFSQESTDIRPGDTIVVPLDAERMRPLPLWTAVTTVIYNLAVAVAAIGSI